MYPAQQHTTFPLTVGSPVSTVVCPMPAQGIVAPFPTLTGQPPHPPTYFAPFAHDPNFLLVSLLPMPPAAVLMNNVGLGYDPYNSFLYSSPTPTNGTYTPPQTPEAAVFQTQPQQERTTAEPVNSFEGSVGTQFEDKQETPESPSQLKPEPKAKKKKTRLQDTPRFRYKQDLIENTLATLRAMFSGRVLPEDQALRGATTLRLHVKTEVAIRSIVEVMEHVTSMEGVEITQVSFPISMKNKYQMKGFLCYFEITDVNMVQSVLNFVQSNYACFDRCKVALPRGRQHFSSNLSTHRMTPQVSDGA